MIFNKNKIIFCTMNVFVGVSVGPFVFNESRDNIRSITPKYFERNSTCDEYDGCTAFYDSNNKLEAVKFYSGKVTIDKSYNKDKLILLPNKKSTIIEELCKLDPSVVIYADRIISKALNIGVYFYNDDVRSVLIGKMLYYYQ